MISGIPSGWALEPECQILMFMWSVGPRIISVVTQACACSLLQAMVWYPYVLAWWGPVHLWEIDGYVGVSS